MEAVEKLAEQLQHELLTDLVVRKLGKHGVQVTPRQRERIRKWFVDGAEGDPPMPSTKQIPRDITINFTRRDERRLKACLTRNLEGKVGGAAVGARNLIEIGVKHRRCPDFGRQPTRCRCQEPN
jgi:hypothetical protein